MYRPSRVGILAPGVEPGAYVALLSGKQPEDKFPFVQAQCLGAPFWIDADFAQARRRGLAADASNSTQRSAKLLAPELEDGFDEAEECIHVRDVHRGLFADLEHHESRVTTWCRRERRGRDREAESGDGKNLDRDGGKAGAG